MNDSLWTLRVCSTGADQATVYARGHQFAVGAPVHFDVRYGQVTALEYALAALGADVVNGLRLVARRRRIPLDEIEAVVGGTLDNPLVYLGVIGATGHPGLARIEVRVYVSTDAAEEQVRRAWEEMLGTSPLVRTFQAALELDLRVSVVP